MTRLPPDVQQRRNTIKGVDALFFSAGLWGLNDWETTDEAKREEGRAQVREAARLVQGAAAAKRVWVSTVSRTS